MDIDNALKDVMRFMLENNTTGFEATAELPNGQRLLIEVNLYAAGEEDEEENDG